VRITPIFGFWLVLMIPMAQRLFPSRWESMGSQKPFAARCQSSGRIPSHEEIQKADRGAGWVALVWIGFNAIILILWKLLALPKVYLLCLVGFYGVCDIICILFLCPFQLIWMKNRCCTTCRIYNWDYLMMCTPLVVLPNFYSLTLLGMSSALVVIWEVAYRRHPERFFESSNESLRCANCQEHLCAYKRKLAGGHVKEHREKTI